MVKKKFPHQDMHHNSSIIINMDEKARLKSDYMKRYNESLARVKVKKIDSRPAGTKNFGIIESPQEGAHLNISRRRILNDFVTRRPKASTLETLANRNAVDAIKIPEADRLAYYDYRGNAAQIGPHSRPGKLNSIQNRAVAYRGNGGGASGDAYMMHHAGGDDHS